jgi:tetratricopeptide (TPR) repeat protein
MNDPGDDRTLTYEVTGQLAPEVRIPHYTVRSFLGAGGMGRVYGAVDERLGRSVAIKLLPAGTDQHSDRVERFTREARAASALNHPNIITVYESGTCEAGRYIVMEMVEGRTLRKRIAEGLSREDALDFAGQMAKAVAVAHAAGIVHRDIKPDNVMVREDGYVKVLDFGLAHLPLDMEGSQGVTGPVMGTLRYMSPEQGQGQRVGTPSDIFSLGLVFYEMFTGLHPFRSATALATFQSMVTEPASPPSTLNPAVPPLLDELILGMLQKQPDQRPPASRVARLLQDLRSGHVLTMLRPIGPTSREPGKTVGREQELAQLALAAGTAADGEGMLVCVAGEAGLGKTTLVEDFLNGLSRDVPISIGRGRCSENAAGAEAHLPVLGALQNLIASDTSGFAARSMRMLAPSWYARVAPTNETGSGVPATEAGAASPGRLKRELTALFQALARQNRVIVVFEDIHWADDATIDVMSYLSSQFDQLGLLLVVTFRESELLQSKHPFLRLKLDLQARRRCRGIVLSFLSAAEVARYVALEFPKNQFPADFVHKIHSRTQGHPLFLADLIRYLKDRRAVIQENGVWILSGTFKETENELPESVRSMVQRKLESSTEQDRRLLAAASLQGHDFDSAVLAKVLELDPLEVEERLATLERVERFVRFKEEHDMPDGTLSCRYQFIHSLYQMAFYETLRPTRRSVLSGATARALSEFYGARKSKIALRLAPLLAMAREWAQAAQYYLLASNNAGYLFAFKEAAALARSGIEAVKKMPASPDRDKLELALQLALGRPLALSGGADAPEAVACFGRASELAREIGDDVEIFPAIFGLYLVSAMAGECRKTLPFARQLLGIATKSGDAIQLAQANHAVAFVLELTGELAEAEGHADLVLAGERRTNAEYIESIMVDPVIGAEWIKCRVLWMKGFPDQAKNQVRSTLKRIDREETDLRSACYTILMACIVHQYCGDAPEVLALAARGSQFCHQYGFEAELQWFMFFEGWALFSIGDRAGHKGGSIPEGFSGERADGISKMRAGMEFLSASGVRMWATPYSAVLADVLVRQGEREEASRWISWALEFGGLSGIRHTEPELRRLQGEILAAEGRLEEAQAGFERAMELAREQGALSLELRIGMGLARFWRARGKQHEAQTLVSDILGKFTEGFETADLIAAGSLLASLRARAAEN